MKKRIFNLDQLVEVEICDKDDNYNKTFAYVNLYFLSNRSFFKTFSNYIDASEWGCDFMYHKYKFMSVSEDENGEKIIFHNG